MSNDVSARHPLRLVQRVGIHRRLRTRPHWQRNPIDVLAMFISLWLLVSMIIDKATPKELTVYMIGTALAPAGVITAVLYGLKVPRYDFSVCVSMLWLVSILVIEIITPKPLSWMIAVIAFAPAACVGIASRLKWGKTTRSPASGFPQPGDS